jgi:uncharacterized protein (DUF302 family)
MNDSQVLIFGNPKIGTLIMQNNILSSIDLPLRIAVVEDNLENIWVVYRNPNLFREEYGFSNSTVLERIDKLLDNVTDSIIK